MRWAVLLTTHRKFSLYSPLFLFFPWKHAQKVVGIEENFCNVAYCNEFLVTNEINKNKFYPNSTEIGYPKLSNGNLNPLAAMFLDDNPINRLSVPKTWNLSDATSIASGYKLDAVLNDISEGWKRISMQRYSQPMLRI